MKSVIYVQQDYKWSRFDWSWLIHLKSSYYLTHIQACGVQASIGPLSAWARYNQIACHSHYCIDEIDFHTRLNQLQRADSILYFPDSVSPINLSIRGGALSYLSRDKQRMALLHTDQYHYALDNW